MHNQIIEPNALLPEQLSPPWAPGYVVPAPPSPPAPPPFLETLQVGSASARRGEKLARALHGGAFLLPDPDTRPIFWECLGKAYLRMVLGTEALSIGRKLRAAAVTWLRGIPCDVEPGPAPYSGRSPVAPLAATLLKVFGVIRLMEAKACAFLDENEGRLVRHVVAVPTARNAASSHGWRAELPWHMDGAYRPFRNPGTDALAPPPRWLVFGVIKSDPSVPITVASVSAAIQKLPAAARDALERAEYAVTTPDSVPHRQTFGQLPVLDRDDQGNLISRYNRGHCRGLTANAVRALDTLEEALTDTDLHLQLPVEPGDVVVIDNWRCLHRRSAYCPAWDGNDRWFVRLYAASRPRGLSGLSPSRARP